MTGALRNLARDGWVLGIACAAALAYVVVRLLESAIGVLLSVIDGFEYPEGQEALDAYLAAQPFTTLINGRAVSFEALLNRSLLLVIVVPLVAIVLHVTRPPDDEPHLED